VCEFFLLLFKHCPTRIGIAIRYVLLCRLARSCGDNVAIFEGVHLFGIQYIDFGDNISIHEMCYVDGSGGLTIGSDVSIAHGTTIMTTDHDYSDPHTMIKETVPLSAPVTIGCDVWVGAGVRILSGQTIGNRVAIGAGAVVTHDVPSGSLAVGVPAKCIKTLSC
jgi:acetyltransferase-like isoleucine patch superfamily enzyme